MTETHNVPELDRAAAVLELQQAIERPLHTVDGALEKLQRSFPDPMREKARTLLQQGIAAGEDRRKWEVTVTAPDGHSTDLTLQDVAGTAGERVGSPMQRFFFDFSDSTRDCVGTELNDLELAEAQARCSLLLAASEDCSSDLSVTIRNEAGLPLVGGKPVCGGRASSALTDTSPTVGAAMHLTRDKRILLAAEEQLAFGRFLADVLNARDELKAAHPESLLLELVEAKVKRMQLVDEATIPL